MKDLMRLLHENAGFDGSGSTRCSREMMTLIESLAIIAQELLKELRVDLTNKETNERTNITE